MDKVSFKGLMLPRGLRFRISSPLFDWYADEEGRVKIKCQCLIDRGAVTVDIYIDQFDLSNAHQLYKRATDLSRTAANMIAIRDGRAVSLLLDKIIYPHGTCDPVTRKEAGAENIVTAFDLDDHSISLSKSLMSAITDAELFMAIDDFVVGISHHHMSEANCRRALDRLRHALAPGVKDRKKGWQIMNSQLNIDSDSLIALTKVMHANSHGEPGYKSGDLVAPTMAKTLTVINRFIEYRNRGSKPLTLQDFPLLRL